MSESLLDVVARRMQVNILSNLRIPSNYARILEIISTIEYDSYNQKEWQKLTDYIVEHRVALRDHEDYQSYLIKFLTK